MIENDWLMRQIKMVSNALSALLLGKTASFDFFSEEAENKEGISISEEMMLTLMLQRYLGEGKINEAENLLFESIEDGRTEKKFQVALSFYNKLDSMSDSFLYDNDFSRQEILDGLMTVKNMYQIDSDIL